MKDLFRTTVMFIVGFMSYITIEVLYRGFSYPSMGIVGGIIFILIDRINERYPWDLDLIYQGIIAGIYAILIELIVGLLDKEWLHINMWDYSDEAFNFMGIICPRFFLYWCILGILGVLVADFINYCLYRDSEPPYYIIGSKKYIPNIYKIL